MYDPRRQLIDIDVLKEGTFNYQLFKERNLIVPNTDQKKKVTFLLADEGKIRDRIKLAIKTKQHVARVYFEGGKGTRSSPFWNKSKTFKKGATGGVYELKHHVRSLFFKFDKLNRVRFV